MRVITAEKLPGEAPLPVADLAILEQIRGQVHDRCLACGQSPWRLNFELEPENTIVAKLRLDETFCGYPETVHGGSLALFFDQMATCCMFAHGIEAVTARLQVRFRQPVRPAVTAVLRARMKLVRRPRYEVRSWLEQEGEIKADAVMDMWVRSSLTDNSPSSQKHSQDL